MNSNPGRNSSHGASKVKGKAAQLCLTLCDLMDYRVHGILQARMLEWVKPLSPSPGDLTNLGIEPRSPTLQVDSLPADPPGKPKNIGVDTLKNTLVDLCALKLPYQLSFQGSPWSF